MVGPKDTIVAYRRCSMISCRQIKPLLLSAAAIVASSSRSSRFRLPSASAMSTSSTNKDCGVGGGGRSAFIFLHGLGDVSQSKSHHRRSYRSSRLLLLRFTPRVHIIPPRVVRRHYFLLPPYRTVASQRMLYPIVLFSLPTHPVPRRLVLAGGRPPGHTRATRRLALRLPPRTDHRPYHQRRHE